ncbi:uncharacterized protein HGUI_00109 [Hanseniaspora guilliermondii]|uniref:BHLH domain-containing protein n=1 Tax=Hanseniaspora guilliermondii TaxID=56406 RepID=A0A1L0CGQ0_9ASCO|nr:uncharacterized protein HGUI_00109 [Hanseniaspora guilliermondii]
MTAKTTEDANIDEELQSSVNAVDVIDAAVEAAKQSTEEQATSDKKAGEKKKLDEVKKDEKKEDKENKDEAKTDAEQALIKDIIDNNESKEEPPAKKQKTEEAADEKEDVIEAPAEKTEIVEPKLTQRKESHKEVERRRRETINVAINELKELCGDYLIQVNKSGFPHSATGHIHFSKSEILNAACGYIKNLKEKIKAVEADFDNYRYASKAELKNVTTANEALEDALKNEKKE